MIKSLYKFKDIHGVHSPIVSKQIYDLSIKYSKEIENAINYNRDFLIDYFGFKTLERAYLMKINGSEIVAITKHESNDYEPIFSPDGQSIVFTSERDGNKEIYLFETESKKLKNLSNHPGNDWNPRFYPDNNKIVFQSDRDGNWEIYLMNVNGSNQRNLTNHPSTDYSYIVFPLKNP